MSKFIGNIASVIDVDHLISHLEDTAPGIIVRADMINNKVNDPTYPTYPGEIEPRLAGVSNTRVFSTLPFTVRVNVRSLYDVSPDNTSVLINRTVKL